MLVILLRPRDIGIDDQIPRSRELHSKWVRCTSWVLLVKHMQDSKYGRRSRAASGRFQCDSAGRKILCCSARECRIDSACGIVNPCL